MFVKIDIDYRIVNLYTSHIQVADLEIDKI